MFELLAKSMVD